MLPSCHATPTSQPRFSNSGRLRPWRFAPLLAVEQQHVGAFRFGQLTPWNAWWMIVGVIDVAGEHRLQFVEPLMAFGPVGADQRVHGKHVHVVVVAFRAFGHDAVPECGIVDDVVASHQSGEIEGLAGRVERHGPVACVLADRLGGDVLVVPQQSNRTKSRRK